MVDRASSFLIGVLGEDGARAFKKALANGDSLQTAVVPRAIMSWLDQVQGGYSGTIPGLEKHLEFRKSEKGYDGAIGIGSGRYSFKNASSYHIAAGIAVALGLEKTRIDTRTRDVTLQRLGKSIDVLVKARGASSRLEKSTALLKAISLISPGAETRERPFVKDKNFGPEYKAHNYSHVLSPEHRDAGYQLHVYHNPKTGGIHALATQKTPGGLQYAGHIKANHEGQDLSIGESDMLPAHQGKGLGSSMYEATMAHGFHNGARQMTGDVHSTMASNTHARVSAKHGMDYQAQPTPFPKLAAPTPGPFDNRVGPYNYTLKEEVPAVEKIEGPGSANKPTAQQAAMAPQAPQFQTQQPKPPGPKTARISKSESTVKCDMCRRPQFQDGLFVGCFCFRDMAHGVTITKSDQGSYTIAFDAAWDADAILALRQAMRAR